MIPIQPWMIKGGAAVLFLSAVFTGGCRVQKQMDKAKIQRIKADYTRAVGIIDTLQDNVDVLDTARKVQNEATAKLGRQHDEKVSNINTAHHAAITRLNAANDEAIRTAEEEAAALRQRMVGLSVGEACDTAMRSIVQ
ncbi:MAG: hypothetical protein KAS32_27075 [Candidatus Peribacteraceae bacterium]|nr:hypothetical protein [Candidatus Peribacteraceae bacterium]